MIHFVRKLSLFPSLSLGSLKLTQVLPFHKHLMCSQVVAVVAVAPAPVGSTPDRCQVRSLGLFSY
jgi:hypothetical protein